MKTCSLCKREKSLAEFNQNHTRKDGLQTKCRDCSQQRSKTYYGRNKTRMRSVIARRKKEVIKENRLKLVDYLLGHPCVDCSESDIVVLDFDHVRRTKKTHVTRMVIQGYAWETILQEIAKCEVRCANCHRRKTSRERGFFRSTVIPGSSIWQDTSF